MRDAQRSKVYAWELEEIAPHDRSVVKLDHVPAILGYIWDKAGLKYPPKVVLMDTRTTRFGGKANREVMYLPEITNTRVILHEAAHAMTMDLEGEGERHGPRYVGVYMKLLEEHLRLPVPMLMFSATKHKVAFDITAKPTILD